MRAVRHAVRGRDVDLSPGRVPIEAVISAQSRLAIAPAVAAFIAGPDGTTPNLRVEALAGIGSTFLHALSLAGHPVSPVKATTIATGPQGSASHTLATVLANTSQQEKTVLSLADSDALTASQALQDNLAEVALLFATPGRPDFQSALSQEQITLVDADAWWNSDARLALPVLREAQIDPGVYAGVDRTVSTIATQLILFGPSGRDHFTMGPQGPGVYCDEVNLRNDRINPYPSHALLLIAIIGCLVWAGWLYIRPEHKSDTRPWE
ncbi:TAXI family TRAP transporter solute-binding subunit [Orrella marina]|uniref:TAXI family TRAP transporter solute-binding subunit n=1 Tax=Orrella marina TaxID=2163011 RepID=UPI00131EE32D|nr:TAXI family TRAP transporter solute-binding subunit [Orrella marina]